MTDTEFIEQYTVIRDKITGETSRIKLSGIQKSFLKWLKNSRYGNTL